MGQNHHKEGTPHALRCVSAGKNSEKSNQSKDSYQREVYCKQYFREKKRLERPSFWANTMHFGRKSYFFGVAGTGGGIVGDLCGALMGEPQPTTFPILHETRQIAITFVCLVPMEKYGGKFRRNLQSAIYDRRNSLTNGFLGGGSNGGGSLSDGLIR